MRETLRFVTARPSKRNPKRWYWQRPGYPLVRLPDDPAARYGRVHQLNAEADAKKPSEAAESTVDWFIEKYRQSDRFKGLAPKTQKIYERWLDQFSAWWGKLHPAAITRRVVVDLADSLETPAHAIACLSSIMEIARYYGLKVDNPCHKLRLKRPKARDQYWLPKDEDAFLAACDDPKLRLTFFLLLYTAQRPTDVLAFTWNQVGEWIKLRQEKTRALVDFPVHKRLREELTRAPRDGVMVAFWRGSAASRYQRFREAFRETCTRAGLDHLQARDLRRTAVVRLSEAGATVPEIAALTGHTIQRTQEIIDTYYVRTREMAQNAITKWERSERKKSNAISAKSNSGK
jgi:integrase